MQANVEIVRQTELAVDQQLAPCASHSGEASVSRAFSGFSCQVLARNCTQR